MKKKHWVILVIFLIVPFLHLLFNFFLKFEFEKILNHKIINLGKINTSGSHQVELLGVYGNVFNPSRYNPEIDYDLIPITCIIDPISLSKGIITWENNDLLRSALINTYPDKETFEKAVDELITTMSVNGELIKYFLFTPPESYKTTDYELRKKLKVYLWDVPKNGEFYIKTRIQKMAALPIFNPRIIAEKNQNKAWLRKNLKTCIGRLFYEIEFNNYKMHSVAFAAFAGSTRRMDSDYYLNYNQSFFTIYDALKSSDIPKQIDRIYFVVYDSLPTKEEEKDALSGLFFLFRYLKHFNLDKEYFGFNPYILRAFPFGIIFIIMFLVTYPNVKYILNKKNRTEFIIKVTSILPLAFFIIGLLFNLVLLTLRYSFIFTFVGELLISYLSYKTIIWVNKI